MIWHPLFTFTGGAAVVVPDPPPGELEIVRVAGSGSFGRIPVKQVVRHEDDEVAIIVSLLARMLTP